MNTPNRKWLQILLLLALVGALFGCASVSESNERINLSGVWVAVVPDTLRVTFNLTDSNGILEGYAAFEYYFDYKLSATEFTFLKGYAKDSEISIIIFTSNRISFSGTVKSPSLLHGDAYWIQSKQISLSFIRQG